MKLLTFIFLISLIMNLNKSVKSKKVPLQGYFL